MKKILFVEKDGKSIDFAKKAFSKTDFKVKILRTPKNTVAAIEKTNADIVIYSQNEDSIDGIELCKSVRQNKKFKNIGFILIEDMENMIDVSEQASSVGINNILTRPYTTEQIIKVVNNVFEQLSKQDQEEDTALLMISDETLRHAISMLLDLYNVKVVVSDTGFEALEISKREKFTFSIVDQASQSSLEWYDAEKMGACFVVLPEDNAHPAIDSIPKGTHYLNRPLTVESFLSTFKDHSLIPQEPEALTSTEVQLDAGEVALLSARISAEIYEHLLHHSSLKTGNWDQASDIAKDSTTRICEEFYARLRSE
jgi:DNA-binding response OmpR family regulator